MALKKIKDYIKNLINLSNRLNNFQQQIDTQKLTNIELKEFKQQAYTEFENARNNRTLLDETRKIIFERSEFLNNTYKSLEELRKFTNDNISSYKETSRSLGELKQIFTLQNEKIEQLLTNIKNMVNEKHDLKINASEIEKEINHLHDYEYVDFENKFRGDADFIKNKQKMYIDELSDVKVLNKPILDIGCGRGEFLEICRENNIAAKGVEFNQIMVEICKKDNLDVELKDAIEYLRSCEDDSFSAITAFQVIEHLEINDLIELLNLSQKKLCKNGKIILETINPMSVYAMKWFYLDLSHKRPLIADSVEILLKSNGFNNTKINYISPVESYIKLQDTTDPVINENFQKINNMLFSNQEYYITAIK